MMGSATSIASLACRRASPVWLSWSPVVDAMVVLRRRRSDCLSAASASTIRINLNLSKTERPKVAFTF